MRPNEPRIPLIAILMRPLTLMPRGQPYVELEVVPSRLTSRVWEEHSQLKRSTRSRGRCFSWYLGQSGQPPKCSDELLWVLVFEDRFHRERAVKFGELLRLRLKEERMMVIVGNLQSQKATESLLEVVCSKRGLFHEPRQKPCSHRHPMLRRNDTQMHHHVER